MTPEEILIGCLEMAIGDVPPRESVWDRARKFRGFAAGDAVKLGCLRLAMKSHGRLARISADKILFHAKEYLDFITPTSQSPQPAKPAARKRGRPRKVTL
jgi:hypothetical protein